MKILNIVTKTPLTPFAPHRIYIVIDKKDFELLTFYISSLGNNTFKIKFLYDNPFTPLIGDITHLWFTYE